MSPVRTTVVSVALGAALLATAVSLLNRELSTGEAYPDYSSLRTDPLGARLLYDSLERVPGIRVERNYQTLEFLSGPPATVLLIALSAERFGGSAEPYLSTVERLARNGHRVVVAFNLPSKAPAPVAKALHEKWGVALACDAKRTTRRLSFAAAPGWTVLDRPAGRTLAIEHDYGAGSVVLFAGSDDFANVSVADRARLPLITAALGENSRVVFDEWHLGIVETGGVMELARRFHLLGIFCGLCVFAGLLIWHVSADFPPPAEERTEAHLIGRTSHAGLLTLLRRHVRPADLIAVCWEEWLRANRAQTRPERIALASRIARGGGDPLKTERAIRAALRGDSA